MPVQLISDKYLQAERRNRLEKSRLDVTCKHFDRETTKLNFEIDREKRFIKKDFRNVVKTSGQSDAGMPPKDDNDTDFEKCPSYRQGMRLSNKRLLEWRECEKQLNKFIQNHNNEMAKNRKRRPVSTKSVMSDKSERNHEENGFDVDNDDVFIDDDLVSATTSVDPMDALKENSNQKKKEFNVKDWEKEIIDSYKKMVGKTVPSPGSKDKNNSATRLKSNSSPAIITTELVSNKVKARMRPHTAQMHRRPPSGRSLPPRPASAHVISNNTNQTKQFIITKDSIFIKTGHKYEKLLDSKSVEKPILINNYLDNLPPGKLDTLSLGKMDTLSPGKSNLRSTSITSINSLCPVQERNEDEIVDENDGDEQTPNDNDLTNGYEIPMDNQVNGSSESENKQQDESQRRQTNHVLLKQAVQKWKRRKSDRLTSEASSMSDAKSRVSLLHSNSDLSSYVESMRRLRKDSTVKHSNTDLSTFVESSRRSRRDSESASSRISLSSYLPSGSLGIPADIEDISHVQEKLASDVSAERPVATNKLIAVTAVVKAAMTFSRVARKRILAKMVDENSTDPHELIRQERLRKVQSRQSVLNSLANQWSDDAKTLIEAVE